MVPSICSFVEAILPVQDFEMLAHLPEMAALHKREPGKQALLQI